MRQFTFANQFKKDLKLMKKRRKEMGKLYGIMKLIISDSPLPDHCREHKLSGNYEGYTECHISPDWLLVYRLDGEAIVFHRTGTHSDLF